MKVGRIEGVFVGGLDAFEKVRGGGGEDAVFNEDFLRLRILFVI